MKPAELFEKARNFLLRDLWNLEVGTGWRRRMWYSLRTGVLVVENTINRELFVRAAALTYQVVFSIIPLFAVMLALMKSFGGLDRMAADVRDFMLENLAPSFGERIISSMNGIIERMNAKAISIIGFVVLTYTSLSLLSTIEHAFNRIWGVPRPRSLLRRVAVYWTLLTVGPVCIAASLAFSGFVRNRAAYLWMQEHIPFANTAIFTIVPFVLTWIVFTLVYKIIPNTRIHWRAAFTGALIAGTSWEILKRLFVLYNSTVTASYEVYGTLAAIPIFLLWIYLSWVLVLFGAEVSFASQHVKTYRRETETPRVSSAFKERLGLHLMVEIARDFLAGRPAVTPEALIDRLKVPVRAGSEVLRMLADAKLLLEKDDHGATAYVPSDDPSRIPVRRIVDAFRGTESDPPIDASGRGHVDRVFFDAGRKAMEPLEKISLRELVETKPEKIEGEIGD